MEIGSKNWNSVIKEQFLDIEKKEVRCWIEPDTTYYDVEKAFSFNATKEQMDNLVNEYIKDGWTEVN